MAFYDIAGAQRRVSPVQEIAQSRASQDAHEINQLNIEAGKIKQPYIKQLLEQDVRRGEQGIEREDVESQYREGQLQQQKQITDLEIDAQRDEAKYRKDQLAFDEALKTGMAPRELKKTFPRQYRDWRNGQLDTHAKEMTLWQDKLDAFEAVPEAGRPAAWAAAMAEAPEGLIPPELMEYSPESYRALKRAFKEQRSAGVLQILDEIRELRAEGTPQAMADADRLIDYMDRMGSRGVGSVASERKAEALYGWSENPQAAMQQFEDYDRRVRLERDTLVKEALSGVSQTDAMFGRISMFDLMQKDPEGYANAMASMLLVAMGTMLSDEEREWYVYAIEQRRKMAQPKARSEPPPTEEEGPATPQTQADFDALEKGAVYIDPDDGKTYRKP